jgi:hypothetical protein
MLQLLLTEAIRHAHYTSDTIKIHLKYEALINDSVHERKVEQLCQGLPTQKDFGEV